MTLAKLPNGEVDWFAYDTYPAPAKPTTELEEQLIHIFGQCTLEPHSCWYDDNVAGKMLEDWQIFEMQLPAIQAVIDTEIRVAIDDELKTLLSIVPMPELSYGQVEARIKELEEQS